ncbi:enoyl-CoA hydratase-related protein [Promicromonospora sp. NPDC050249]|uniref:enoyl-CoA hydratase/isomerase family protein n=1 Tax=Promicromonospora sp. NPDC050249 TaxID=3154743 RepID=UPI0033D2F743
MALLHQRAVSRCARFPAHHLPGGRLDGALIDDHPSHLWVKGIPTAGVGNIERLFRRVVWVATGSGIGPCLPHLLSRETPSRLVWSTRDPRATYGDDLVDEILAVQPDPVIWDTTASGKPDLLALAYQAYREFDAEAVICCVRLHHRVGPSWAKELIYTGRKIDAMEARRIGLVNRVFDTREEMLDSAAATLAEIATRSPVAVASCKSVIGDSVGRTTTDALDIEKAAFRTTFATGDMREGTAAFLAKRPPSFPGH